MADDYGVSAPITLTGDGATGLLANDRMRAAVAQLPVTVRLGRRPPRGPVRTLMLEDYADFLASVPIPDSADWYTKASASVNRMYCNDRLGCCVFSGKHHQLGLWSANDPDSFGGQTVLATDAEVSKEYFDYTGGADNGANIADVFGILKSRGLVAGGVPYTIRGFVSCDPRNKDLVRAGIYLFGGGTIGINLPGAWTSSAVWDVTNSGTVGGHDVTLGGYGKQQVITATKDGVIILSWGRLYLLTWDELATGKHVDEMYFSVPTKLWVGTDGIAPNGVDLSTLLADLDKLGGGTVPPMPDPSPGPTPGPVVYRGSAVIPPSTGSVRVPFFGTLPVVIPGQTVPVVVSSDGFAVPALSFGITWPELWQLLQRGGPIVRDVLRIVADYQSKNWSALAQDVLTLVADLGIQLPGTLPGDGPLPPHWR